MEDDGKDGRGGPESLLPYDEWTEDALRHVAVRALAHAAANGLPGDHHFYLTFRTDQPGVSIPSRLRAQYPREMTIVLQHQFWDLAVDEAARQFSVGLSFGGVPSTLVVPFSALVAFADPHVQYGLRFHPPREAAEPPAPPSALPAPVPAAPAPETPEAAESPTPQVVSLDAFRRRPSGKE